MAGEQHFEDVDGDGYADPHESTLAGLFGLPGNVEDAKVESWFPWFDKRLAFSNMSERDIISLENQLVMFHYARSMGGKTREELAAESQSAHTSFMQTRVHAMMSSTLGKNGFLIRRLTEHNSITRNDDGDNGSQPRSLKDMIFGSKGAVQEGP